MDDFFQRKLRTPGFTLAELLIALAILGVIATFTIPKVLQSQQDGRFKSVGKETVAMISESMARYQLSNSITGSVGSADFTQYMNYLKVDTASTIDDIPTLATVTCSATAPCLRLVNGAALRYDTVQTFINTASTSAIRFMLDPDGKVTANGEGMSIWFYLYPNGRVTTWKTLAPGTMFNGSSYVSCSNCDPTWFGWD